MEFQLSWCSIECLGLIYLRDYWKNGACFLAKVSECMNVGNLSKLDQILYASCLLIPYLYVSLKQTSGLLDYLRMKVLNFNHINFQGNWIFRKSITIIGNYGYGLWIGVRMIKNLGKEELGCLYCYASKYNLFWSPWGLAHVAKD